MLDNLLGDLQMLIESHGLWVMTPIIFAETGLLVGFFLPGDSLLFIAGAAAAMSQGRMDPWLVVGCLTLAAIAGNTLNYWLGRWLGDWLRQRPDGRILKRKYLDEAHAFYEKWGPLSLVVTRWTPVLRTFVPFVAGAAGMGFRRYTMWNVIGALCWVPVLVAMGWWLGQVPFFKEHLETMILAVVAVSLLPVGIAAWLRWRAARKQAAAP